MPIHSQHSHAGIAETSATDHSVRRSHRVSFPGGSGHQLTAIVDVAQSQHQAPVVLFSHCFTCNKDLKAIVRISRHLAAMGFNVLRYDMTGLGGSEGHFTDTNFETNLADCLAAAHYAAKTLGPPTVLMGHSLGGAASLAAAANWPQELPQPRGVATLAAPSDTRHLAELLVRMDPRVETEGKGRVTIGGRHWETRPEMIANLRHYDLPKQIAKLKIPLLLFHSPEDETVAFDHALRIMSWVAEPPASLVVLPKADHLLLNNAADIQFVAETLAAWTRRLLAQDATST